MKTFKPGDAAVMHLDKAIYLSPPSGHPNKISSLYGMNNKLNYDIEIPPGKSVLVVRIDEHPNMKASIISFLFDGRLLKIFMTSFTRCFKRISDAACA